VFHSVRRFPLGNLGIARLRDCAHRNCDCVCDDDRNHIYTIFLFFICQSFSYLQDTIFFSNISETNLGELHSVGAVPVPCVSQSHPEGAKHTVGPPKKVTINYNQKQS
jgi:hypothetical protein